jgi:xanthine dehydrogenase molybdopterin-binding subunit B
MILVALWSALQADARYPAAVDPVFGGVKSMNSSDAMADGIGQPVRRKEDFRLLTGRGSFADDVHLPEVAHAVIVRSPHPHALIASIDKAAALAPPGVLVVLTG